MLKLTCRFCVVLKQTFPAKPSFLMSNCGVFNADIQFSGKDRETKTSYPNKHFIITFGYNNIPMENVAGGDWRGSTAKKKLQNFDFFLNFG